MESLSADQLMEQLRADIHLANLDLFEDLALLHDTEPNAQLRADFARQYHKLLGVDPPQRLKFQAGLQAILDGNGKIVAELIANLEAPAPPPTKKDP